MRAIFVAVLAVPLLSTFAFSQAVSHSKTISGQRLYEAHCVLCHGPDAKGGGPFSPQLKTWPPDLTTLAMKNNGNFPAMRVSESIDGEFDKSSHGSKDMPIWGPTFRAEAKGHADNAALRIRNLVKYIESLQQK